MVVICPKCKIKLKVDDAKLSSAGSRFKCPKCSTVLILKKPSVQPKKTLDRSMVLVAHSNPEILESAKTILQKQGYKVLTSTDGIDVMIKALKDLPFLAVAEVSLPKIYGFEICKKLKARTETKEMKFILIPSIFDKSKYKREPTSLYGADDYIESHDIPAMLIEKINRLAAMPEESTEKPSIAQIRPAPPSAAPASGNAAPESRPEFRQQPTQTESKPSETNIDVNSEKAKRLSRTIISDIYLYSPAKVMESIKNGNFYNIFASELMEGRKLYENRIPKEIRDKADYYRETIEDFISKKKNELS